ncbi:unnamed protein product [Adineta ricciae]|uniref:Uncharacterized protein n=1 Tax=Adineta ricciae TaxID=249248 RepID=A0A815SUH9_ADIRI|nr:unnamed protein product [Adineta ricciae]
MASATSSVYFREVSSVDNNCDFIKTVVFVDSIKLPVRARRLLRNLAHLGTPYSGDTRAIERCRQANGKLLGPALVYSTATAAASYPAAARYEQCKGSSALPWGNSTPTNPAVAASYSAAARVLTVQKQLRITLGLLYRQQRRRFSMPVIGRRAAVPLAEGGRKVLHAVEAGRKPHVRHRLRRIPQQNGRVFQAGGHEKLVGRAAGEQLKDAAEMERAHMAMRSHILQRNVLYKMVADKSFRPLYRLQVVFLYLRAEFRVGAARGDVGQHGMHHFHHQLVYLQLVALPRLQQLQNMKVRVFQLRAGEQQGAVQVIVAEKARAPVNVLYFGIRCWGKIEDGAFVRHGVHMGHRSVVPRFGDEYATVVRVERAAEYVEQEVARSHEADGKGGGLLRPRSIALPAAAFEVQHPVQAGVEQRMDIGFHHHFKITLFYRACIRARCLSGDRAFRRRPFLQTRHRAKAVFPAGWRIALSAGAGGGKAMRLPFPRTAPSYYRQTG